MPVKDIYISNILITEMFRSLIFAGAGESVSKMANTASNALMSIKNAGADAAGRTGAMIAGFRDPNAEDSSPGRAGGGNGNGNGNGNGSGSGAAASSGGGGSGGGGMKPRTGSFGGSNPNYMRTAYKEIGQQGIKNAKTARGDVQAAKDLLKDNPNDPYLKKEKAKANAKVFLGGMQTASAFVGSSMNSFERQSRDWTNLALNQDTRMRYCMEDDVDLSGYKTSQTESQFSQSNQNSNKQTTASQDEVAAAINDAEIAAAIDDVKN